MRIYVGNLPWSTNDNGLKVLFETFGAVKDAKVVTDRDTGKSRGFGFVEMDDEAAREAIKQLNGQDLDGRALNVNEARPRENRGGGGGGGDWTHDQLEGFMGQWFVDRGWVPALAETTTTTSGC